VANLAHALRVNAAELLRQPGAVRRVDVELPASAIGVDDERVDGEVQVGLTATSGIDGVMVHGEIRTPWHAQCRRCLADVEGVAVSEVDERFQVRPTDDDSLEIVGDQIDLVPIVREYVLLDLPDAPLCRPDCAGICPNCGADRNLGECHCDTTPRDLRWSALEDLRLEQEG
jgi:uncharacterized protein